MNGVISTHVGYAGGTKKNPTYHSLGDHTETIQIDFDPAKVSYEELLAVFWSSHDPTATPWSRQYRSLVLYHSEEQRKLALATKTRLEEKLKKKIHTEIVPAGQFYAAEEYHQKYYLRSSAEVVRVLREVYTTDADLVASTAAARLNGCLGGAGKGDDLGEQLRAAGLPLEALNKIWGVLSGEDGRFLSCSTGSH